MSWWTQRSIHPKIKSRFVVSIGSGGNFFLPNVRSVTKPAVEINSKEYRLINHTFNYPGTVKWSPITITFVDMNGNPGADIAAPTTATSSPGGSADEPGGGFAGFDTAKLLNQMLNNSGYANPSLAKHKLSVNSGQESTISVPEKASTNDGAFGIGIDGTQGLDRTEGSNTGALVIYQLAPDGSVTEQWTLKNPIIKSIKWGDLSYDSDDLVEYSMDVIYDWAEITSGGQPPLGTAYQSFRTT